MGDTAARHNRLGPFNDKELKVIELAASGMKPLEIMRVMGACRNTTYHRLDSAKRKAGVDVVLNPFEYSVILSS